MYNLFKLLSDEPRRIEKSIILFAKLLLTLLISGLIFHHKLSVHSIIDMSIDKKFALSNILYFLLLITAVWFVFWGIVNFLCEGLILILQKIGNKRDIFYLLLDLFNIAKIKGKELSPEKNVILFTRILNSYNEKDHEVLGEDKVRTKEYFILSTVGYFTLLFIPEVKLSTLEIWMGAIIVVNTLLGSIAITHIHSYLHDNIEEMKKQFNRLAFCQKIWNCVSQNEFIKTKYEIIGSAERIRLNLKEDVQGLPERIRIHPFYYWNELLGKRQIEFGVERLKKIEGDNNRYTVVIGNIDPGENIRSQIKKQEGFAYLYCDTDNKIDEHFDLFIFEISKNLN